MILAGLEDPGTLYRPPANDPNQFEFKKHVKDVRKAYDAFFRHGYFITSKMSKELQDFGTTTIIATGLAVMCNEIDEIQNVKLDKNGDPVVQKPEEPKYGVKISYTSPEGEKRTIYYFKQNLSDGNLSAAFTKFMKKQKIDTSFYKASMYAPHMKSFSKVNALAREARYVVQSDSGLKVSELQKDKNRKIRLFGQYSAPDKMFATPMQEEMKTAYANSICKDGDEAAKGHFTAIWKSDPCTIKAAPQAAMTTYGGALPFRYDYSGVMNEPEYATNLIYAVREEAVPDSSFVDGN